MVKKKTKTEKPELISFNICPFVQRSVITLLEKRVPFNLTYIDLANKPDWFLKISPFGKVPVLKTGKTVLFESAVINEYLDEVMPPSLHPKTALDKAHNRAWIEFGSALNMDMFNWSLAKTKKEMAPLKKVMIDNLKKVEKQMGKGPYFNGIHFSLVDAAYAPFFMRVAILESRHPFKILSRLTKLQKWSEALLHRSSVIESVDKDLDQNFVNYIKDRDVAMSKMI
ncbi:MAG: glutathione S-transferase [Candidatus Marinamargulisbacteria bacterium]|jgi:glutathione S-transferase